MANSKKTRTKKEKGSDTYRKSLAKAQKIIKSLKGKDPGLGPKVILEDLRAIKEIHSK